ncbi:hypothetical protein DB88DRAFT_466553 [Papiliotrema laurentii]|uniref:Large ribosomal subunit protein bL21m n=1 Tax=Papiliotrema laurentii TaxID=5418 RepID=A0AAD9FNQ6_PAPLA|nr:hypothetical protein DB88DRAFT_466553 [Papiliotrema laurentii]
MRARSLIPQAITARLPSRSLQTTPPLPPPTTALPPSDTPLASSSKRPQHLAHLPPILPRQPATPLPTSVPEAISLLKSQSTQSNGIYVIARLFSRTFLLHPRDIISVPKIRPIRAPGTILRLTRIQEVGSRDFAIRAPSADSKILRRHMDFDARTLPDIPSELVTCELTVLENTTTPQEIRFKLKRRKGYRKTIKARHAWTRVKVGDIVLNSGAHEGVELGAPSQ